MEQMRVGYQPLWRIRLKLWRKSLANNWAIFRKSVIGVIGLAIIIFFGIFGAFYPVYQVIMHNSFIYDPIAGYALDEPSNPAPPSWRHPLGTDPIGRDIMSQLMYSTPREFMLGVLAALISVFIGTLIGAISAYYGGFTDTFFMRTADVFMLFPFIATLIVLSAVMKLDIFKLALVLGILGGFGGITLILKSQALSVAVKPYIQAAKVAGGSNFHVIATHIIPNVLPISFLYMMFNVTGAIFSEAALSFFGLLNIRMSWGLMIHTTDTAGYLLGSSLIYYWWLWLPPGLSVTALCAAFYLVGRGLDEVVNPRLRER